MRTGFKSSFTLFLDKGAKPPVFRNLSTPIYRMGTMMYIVSLGMDETSGETFQITQKNWNVMNV